MNEPLKFKMHSLYGQILRDRALSQAWRQVKANKGSGGVDNETIETFGENEEENIMSLLKELKEKEYRPAPVRRIYIPKKNGDKRPLGIPVIKDRIVQQTLVNILTPKFEEEIFHKCSCGYRPNYGMEKTMQLILWNIEKGRNHIFDCDIKGFFDNIPHKKLIKVLNKYIADGTVLDMIWKWLKAGYIEEGKYLDTKSGTPQGGVISPLLANIYLNELDWELEKEGIYFVRYADDFLLFAESEEEIQRAGQVAKNVIDNLGLEVAMNKTKYVDFNDDDFTFVGFDFLHWRKSKRTGKKYFMVKPTKASIKDYKKKIKDATRKTLTLNKEEWVKRVNPIIRGKVNYYLTVHKATELNKIAGQDSHVAIYATASDLNALDAYTRQRLRKCMIHGHSSVRRAFAMTQKWDIQYFCTIGLIPANWLFYNNAYGYSIEEYIETQTERIKSKNKKKLETFRNRGENYFTKHRLNKIANSKRLASA